MTNHYNTLKIDVMFDSIYGTLIVSDGAEEPTTIEFFVYKFDIGVVCCEYLEHPCLSPYEKIMAILPAIEKSRSVKMLHIVRYLDYLHHSSDRDGMCLCRDTIEAIGQNANVIGEKIYDMALSGNVKIFKGESLYDDMMMLHKYTELIAKVKFFALMRYGGQPDYLEIFYVDNSGGGLN